MFAITLPVVPLCWEVLHSLWEVLHSVWEVWCGQVDPSVEEGSYCPLWHTLCKHVAINTWLHCYWDSKPSRLTHIAWGLWATWPHHRKLRLKISRAPVAVDRIISSCHSSESVHMRSHYALTFRTLQPSSPVAIAMTPADSTLFRLRSSISKHSPQLARPALSFMAPTPHRMIRGIIRTSSLKRYEFCVHLRLRFCWTLTSTLAVGKHSRSSSRWSLHILSQNKSVNQSANNQLPVTDEERKARRVRETSTWSCTGIADGVPT